MKKQLVYLLILTLFISRVFAQDNSAVIKSAMESVYQSPPSDWVVTDQSTDKNTGLTHVYVQQKYHGIPVYNAISILVFKNNKMEYNRSGFIQDIKKKANGEKPSITAAQAIDFALKHLDIASDPSIKQLESPADNKYLFSGGSIANNTIKVELVYTPKAEKVILSWNVSIDLKEKDHWWNVRVDAVSGDFLDKNDYVAQDRFDFNTNDEDGGGVPNQSSSPAYLPPPPNSYNVFPLPLEAPTFGSRVMLTNPANPTASPFGWHDVNGAAGAEFTITRGNNVYAYEDQNNDDLPGYSPDGGASLVFDFPYNITSPALNQKDASLTNLFYCNNAIHDILNYHGFAAADGNFQVNNYGGGGLGNDEVLAEGFDGSGTDNANFATPPDGQNPRMQMYLWSGFSCQSFGVNSPAPIAGPMTVGGAGYNPFPATVSGDLILANDGSLTPTFACNPLVNVVTGKIVVVNKGTCPEIYKTYYSQIAGAIGVIIINDQPGVYMAPGFDPIITIPTVVVSQSDGAILLNSMLSNTVNVTINTCAPTNTDSDFDNGIIAHEFGHGLSNRLTGGPSNANCLGNAEQGGEGWSDWLALILTIEPGDVATDERGIGTYALAQNTSDIGIRTYPYSTDMSINPHTYADLHINGEVHYIGEIWCSAIWDLSWLLIDAYGYNADPTVASAGNNLAIKLILEGMKLQPCGPGFLDARDAILQADYLLYNDAHRCLIWQAFARRGMGYYASQGSANVVGDEVQDFAMPPSVQPFPTGGGVFCLPGNTILDAGAGWGSYSWSSGQNTRTIVPTQFGTYTVTVTGVGCDLNAQTGSASVIVRPTFQPITSATPPEVCLHGSSQLDATDAPQFGSDVLTNGPFSSPSPYGNWWTANHEQYLILASELTAKGLLPGNITSLAFDVVEHNTYNGSKNLSISLAHTLVSDLTTTFINTGFSQVFSSPSYTSVVGWNTHTFSSPFNWDGVSNIVIDISMMNCSTCPATPCIDYTTNDVIHLSNTSFTSCSYTFNDNDCSIPSFTPSVPVMTTPQRPNMILKGVQSPSTFSWTPGTFLNNTAIHNPLASNVTASTTYTVTVTKPNGCYASATQSISLIAAPVMPNPITGKIYVCKGQTGVVYCVDEVPGALSYIWTLPSGASGTSTTNCITVNFNSHFNGGNICVKAVNTCSVNGPSRCQYITRITAVPARPGVITGPVNVCLPGTNTYCIASVPKADSYIWSITGNGGSFPMTITSGQGTLCITVNQPTGYNGNQHVSVKAQNCKGLSAERKMDVHVITIPAKPGTISGPASVCKSNTKTYSVSSVSSATSYTWTITGGANITTGQGTRTIQVKFTTASSNSAVLSVTSNNACGSSTARTKSISVNLNCKLGEGDESDPQITSNLSSYSLYPNPTSGKFTVSFISESKSKMVFKVVDMIGNVVYRDEMEAAEGSNTKDMDLVKLAKGVYFLNIENAEGNTQNLRIVLQ